jgi:hypothetical protein
MGVNDKSRAINRLKDIIGDISASPARRLNAANELLARFGPSKRAVPIIKGVAKTFVEYKDSNPTKQQSIRDQAKELRRALKASLSGEPLDGDEGIPAPSEPIPTLAAAAPTPTESNLDLLPPDEADDFWDSEFHGKTRREVLCMSFGLPLGLPHERKQIIAAAAAQLRCRPDEIELRPGRDNPPYTFVWLPQVSVRGQHDNLNGSL